MTIKKMLSRLLVVSALTFLALPAFAGKGKPSESASCNDLDDRKSFSALDTLCVSTSVAVSLSTRDKNGLIGKVLSADSKLTLNKVIDAGDKLGNYETKLDDLNESSTEKKEKISHADYVKLSDEVLIAQECVGGL